MDCTALQRLYRINKSQWYRYHGLLMYFRDELSTKTVTIIRRTPLYVNHKHRQLLLRDCGTFLIHDKFRVGL